MRAGWLTLTATGLAAIGVSAVAIGAVRSSDRVTIPGQSLGSAIAKCPHGKRAVAAGFESPDFHPGDNGGGVVRVTSKVGGSGNVKTRGTHKPRLKVSSGSTSVPAFANGRATATCPGGSEAVSGGAAGFGPLDATVIPFTSKRVGDDKWRVFGFNNDQNNAEQLTAFAYCDKHGPGLKEESAHATVPPQEKRSATANCGRGEKAYSGGYAAKLGPGADGAVAFTSKKTKGGDWTVAAEGNFMTTGSFTVFAYCKT